MRWSEDRIQKIEELGWEDKRDGDIIDDALEAALENERIGEDE